MPSKYQVAKASFHRSRWEKNPVKPCHYCGIGVSRETCTTEHVVAQASRKGKKRKADKSNFRISCASCNSRRGRSSYDEFKAMMLPIKQQRLAVT